jgi:hypothetical protein
MRLACAAVQELQSGTWHWEAPHPDWKPGEEWDQVVSSYAIDDGDRLVLFDPLAPPSEIDGLAAGRETEIVLNLARGPDPGARETAR